MHESFPIAALGDDSSARVRVFGPLHFAVRPRVVARYLGQMLVVVAGLTSVPLCVALASGQYSIAVRYGVVMALLGGLGALGARLRCTDVMQANEALVTSASVFVVSGLAMAYPIAGYGVAPLDAIFEAISGVTTTGLSTSGGLEGRPPTFLFGRAWLQWIGGLGVVVLALAFVLPSGVAARRLGFDDRESAGYVGGTRANARRILFVYGSLTAAGIALCWLSGMSGFDALVHTFAAVSTGGFAAEEGSLAAYGPLQRSVVLLLCLFGALPFLAFAGARGSLRRLIRESRIAPLLVLTTVTAGVVALSLQGTHPHFEPATSLGQGAWMAVSAQTTAGFSTLDLGTVAPSGQLALIASMVVGGEVGSTAGGLKLLRFLVLARLVGSRVLRASLAPNAVQPLRLGGTRLDAREIEGAAALALAYGVMLVLSWLAFLAYGHPPMDALFDVASALGTVGLSSGLTGPDLEPALKVVLCFDMLLGRVEIFALLVLLFPGTWLGRRRSAT